MGAQQGKERERTNTNAGSLHSLNLSAPGSRPVKPKTNSLRPARDGSSRTQAFNVFVEHNGEFSGSMTTPLSDWKTKGEKKKNWVYDLS